MNNFYKIIESVLQEEGGYVNDPLDNGGETNFGISKRSYPEIDIKNLTKDNAINIYKKDFWDKYNFEKINSFEIQKKLFSMSVNMGFKRAFLLLQKSINFLSISKIKEDGIFGEKSLFLLNNLVESGMNDVLLERYKETLKNYYISLNQKKFQKGWIKRALSFNNDLSNIA